MLSSHQHQQTGRIERAEQSGGGDDPEQNSGDPGGRGESSIDDECGPPEVGPRPEFRDIGEPEGCLWGNRVRADWVSAGRV